MTRYCIMSHNRSLPTDLDHFERMVRRNSDLSHRDHYATDVDWLLALAEDDYDTIWWTAPEDFEPGGILLVHLRELPGGAMSPELLQETMERTDASEETLAPNLFHAENLAQTYGGTIFAAARVGSVAEEFVERAGKREHSVLLNRACVFDSPLPVREFADMVEVGGGLFTGLDRAAFQEVRARLAEHNDLPEFLEAA